MQGLLAARKRFEAARAPALVLWLLVACFLLGELFPTPDYAEVSGIHPANSSVVLLEIDDPALPTSPFIPPLPARMELGYPARLASVLRAPQSNLRTHAASARNFDPRGPPSRA